MHYLIASHPYYQYVTHILSISLYFAFKYATLLVHVVCPSGTVNHGVALMLDECQVNKRGSEA
jgi:hypothetical protein